MSNKTFLILDLDYVIEDNIPELEEKIREFIIKTFSETNVKNITSKAQIFFDEEDENITEDSTEFLKLEMEFTEYKRSKFTDIPESMSIFLKSRGLQPFYINGKFVALEVFEFVNGLPLQDYKEVYEIDKDTLYDEFENYMLTC